MSNHEGLPLKAQDNSQESYNSIQNESEYQNELQRKRVNAIYSSVLTLINFQERKTPDTKELLVTPYYEKALRTQKQAEQAAKKEAFVTGEPMKKIEKIPSENPKDRKNYAYLERLDLAIERGGNKLEQRIWQESIKNFAPIIEKENITKKSWEKLEEQFHKDRKESGLPPVEYLESYKEKDYKKLRQGQVDTLAKWTEYLSNKEAPFPTWFKVYAFDGITKIGTYDSKHGRYEKRNNTTIAPYPDVNPAVLANTFNAVNVFYGQDRDKWFDEHIADDELNAVVKLGNFGKIYTHFFNEAYEHLPTPERTEDIKGQWFDFYPGDEEQLAEASRGTPWCIANTAYGKNYLHTNDENITNNQSRFRLFKLENDSSIDGMSKTACASIRFDPQGKVAEVSGLANGSNQTIQDSLVPVVEQEVFKHPLDPDQHFKEKFRDKKELIRLQDKAKKGEDLTLDEYAFLYENDRIIFTLDTYGGPDLKIAELRNFYNISRLLQSDNKDALDQDLLMQKLECILKEAGSSDLAANIDTLLENGIGINTIFNKLNSYDTSQNIDTLLENGIGINTIFYKLDSNGVSQSLDALLEKGIDIKTIFNKLDSNGISQNFNTLLENGINVNSIFSKLDSHDISQSLDTLLENGTGINDILDKLDGYIITKNLDTLLEKGININTIFDKLDNYHVLQNIDTLLEKGININTIFDKLDSYHVSQNIDTLLEKGIDTNTIVNKLGSYYVSQHLDTLLEKGIDVDIVFDKLDSYHVSQNLNTFFEKGININSIFDKLDSYDISQHLDTLLEKGIDINTIFDKLDSYGISQNLDVLLEKGINVNSIFDKLDSHDISQHLNTLLEKGIGINDILDKLDSDGISQNFEILSKNNIPPSLLISKMNLQGIESHLDIIQSDPADIKAAQSVIYRDIFINSIGNLILENISEDVIIDNVLDNQLDSVIKGGNLELAMNKMMEETLPDSLKTFLEQHPADFNNIKPELYSKLVSEFIASYIDSDEVARLNDDRAIRSLVGPDLIYNLNNLLQIMPIDRIVANMRPADIETYHDELVAHGATL